MMERRVTSHTEEEEMNQRRKLLGLARKGDLKAIDKLLELYQVKIYSGDLLKKVKPQIVKPSKFGESGGSKGFKTSIRGKGISKTKLKKPVKPVTSRSKAKVAKISVSPSLKKSIKGTKGKITIQGKSKPKPKAKPKTHSKPEPKPKAKEK